jgi:ribonuclease HI
VDIGEALGPYRALQWVIDLGFDDMNFSLDSKVVVDAFNSGSNNNTEFGSII